MLTVKEFKDLGVVFVAGDKCEAFGQDYELLGGVFSDTLNDAIVTSFAWRTYAGTKPNLHGDVEFTFNGEGCEMQETRNANNIDWSIVKKWRPLLDQSKKTPYDVAAHVSGEKVKPVFTQEMANAGELPPIGSLFLNETIEVECIAIHNDRVITVSDSVYYSLPSDKCHPIGLTPKQKAVGAALKLFTDGEPIENALSKLYDLWRK